MYTRTQNCLTKITELGIIFLIFTSYIDTSYCIHILWEVCRSVFLWATLCIYRTISLFFSLYMVYSPFRVWNAAEYAETITSFLLVLGHSFIVCTSRRKFYSRSGSMTLFYKLRAVSEGYWVPCISARNNDMKVCLQLMHRHRHDILYMYCLLSL